MLSLYTTIDSPTLAELTLQRDPSVSASWGLTMLVRHLFFESLMGWGPLRLPSFTDRQEEVEGGPHKWAAFLRPTRHCNTQQKDQDGDGCDGDCGGQFYPVTC